MFDRVLNTPLWVYLKSEGVSMWQVRLHLSPIYFLFHRKDEKQKRMVLTKYF